MSKSTESNAQKKEHAKLLYIDGCTVGKELAKRVGVSAQTISKWINENDKQWERLRQSTLITKEVEIRRLYEQLTELNDHIAAKEKGKRFADSKEGDVLSKLSKSIKELETETSLAEIMEVMKNFLVFARTIETESIQKIISLADQFVKSNIK